MVNSVLVLKLLKKLHFWARISLNWLGMRKLNFCVLIVFWEYSGKIKTIWFFHLPKSAIMDFKIRKKLNLLTESAYFALKFARNGNYGKPDFYCNWLCSENTLGKSKRFGFFICLSLPFWISKSEKNWILWLKLPILGLNLQEKTNDENPNFLHWLCFENTFVKEKCLELVICLNLPLWILK